MADEYKLAICVFCGVPATPPLGPGAEDIANGLIIDKGQWLSEPLRYVGASTYVDSGEFLETYTTGQAWPYHQECMEQWNIATESKPWTPEILAKTFSKLGMRSATTYCLRGIDYGIVECFVDKRWGRISHGFDDVLQPPSSNAILYGFYRCLIAEAYIGGMSTLRFFGSEDSLNTSSVESSTISDSPEQRSLIGSVSAAVDLFLQRIQQSRAEETEPHGQTSIAAIPWAEDSSRPSAEALVKLYEDSIRQFPQNRDYGQAFIAVASLSAPCTYKSSDPFYKLGPALIFCIIDFLNIPDVCRLRKASRSFARLRLSFGFWRARLRRDMPFLYDFVVPEKMPLDWRLLYMVLDGISSRSQSLTRQRNLRGQTAAIFNLPFTAKRHLTLHNLNVLNITLLNRRRIWESIDQIIDSKADDDGGLNEWIVRED
ncbi:unnamed protein product [Fusarium equiseti]|uniref:F-box domain-containing protein n=1 Tax=Fusarium equiseti TaxID=61235 RepID=A0A8J2NL56_FUSEQ|nr:unnamed protein product [Fusarium equiseti]